MRQSPDRHQVVRVVRYHGQLEAGNVALLTEESVQKFKQALAAEVELSRYRQLLCNRIEQRRMVMAQVDRNARQGKYQRYAEIEEELRGPVKTRGGTLDERIRQRCNYYVSRGQYKSYSELVAECGG